MDNYGQEFILDLHQCTGPYNRHHIKLFMAKLCDAINMEREDLHFWDYEGDPDGYNAAPDHLKGVSAVQFIKTSNITIHTLDAMGRVYMNVFSCKSFEPVVVEKIALEFFGGEIVNKLGVDRV